MCSGTELKVVADYAAVGYCEIEKLMYESQRKVV